MFLSLHISSVSFSCNDKRSIKMTFRLSDQLFLKFESYTFKMYGEAAMEKKCRPIGFPGLLGIRGIQGIIEGDGAMSVWVLWFSFFSFFTLLFRSERAEKKMADKNGRPD